MPSINETYLAIARMRAPAFRWWAASCGRRVETTAWAMLQMPARHPDTVFNCRDGPLLQCNWHSPTAVAAAEARPAAPRAAVGVEAAAALRCRRRQLIPQLGRHAHALAAARVRGGPRLRLHFHRLYYECIYSTEEHCQ